MLLPHSYSNTLQSPVHSSLNRSKIEQALNVSTPKAQKSQLHLQSFQETRSRTKSTTNLALNLTCMHFENPQEHYPSKRVHT